MGPEDAATVTLERRYFDTLVRRAQLHTSDIPVSRSPPNDAITVCRTNHEALRKTARQYANLCQNLLRGGVEQETINLLSQDDAAIKDNAAGSGLPAPQREQHGVPQPKAALDPTLQPRHATLDRRPSLARPASVYVPQTKFSAGRSHDQDWSDADVVHDELSASGDAPADDANGLPAIELGTGGGRFTYDRQCARTIQLLNLPDGVTHADITNVVRGGMLLDIFLRSNDRSATVSFLNGVDAKGFFDHCRRHDLYVRTKRVEVRWSERQFILPGHVAGKIGIGATRNLVVRRCDPRITEEVIREDLSHIHNLVVIRVSFVGGACYISTNSVHNAMFARTCMMSRQKFKGSKIDWDVDECAQPLDRTWPPKVRKEVPSVKKPAGPVTNRFQLLNMDDEDEDEASPSLVRAQETVGIIA